MNARITRISLLALLILALAVLPVAALAVTPSRGGIDRLAEQNCMEVGAVGYRDLIFQTADFDRALGTTAYRAIKITALPSPSEGLLKCAGNPVAEGETIERERLTALTFSPATPITREASFRFLAEDVSITETTCRIRIAEGENLAPSAATLPASQYTLHTMANLPIKGALTGRDPEGDSLTFLVVSYPSKGALLLDAETGSFRYSPSADFTGTDSFRYVVRDRYGSYSEPCTIYIRIGERVSERTYADLTVGTSLIDALTLEAAGIMQGELVGADRYFRGDELVTSGEFVAMAMHALGIKPAEGSAATFFDNDSELRDDLRPYLAVAASRGFLSGSFEQGRLIYDDSASLTIAEASVLLARMLGITGDGSILVGITEHAPLPPATVACAAALLEAGILRPTNGSISLTAPLTRASCASLLASLLRAEMP